MTKPDEWGDCRFTLVVPEDVLTKVDSIAAKEGISRSALIRMALRKLVWSYEKQQLDRRQVMLKLKRIESKYGG